MAGLGWPEILGIALIIALVFGVGKIADVGPALGKAISGFRRAVKEGEEADEKVEVEEEETPAKEA